MAIVIPVIYKLAEVVIAPTWMSSLIRDITYRPGKLIGKLDILSRESGDSPWEGEIKHQ
jgi:hypothetical protein